MATSPKENYTQISKDNEIKTKYAITDLGYRQIIVDPYVPDCVFKFDCLFTQWIQKPAVWKERNVALKIFHYFVLITAEIVNSTR